MIIAKLMILGLTISSAHAQWTSFRGDHQNTGRVNTSVYQVGEGYSPKVESFKTNGLIWGSAVEDKAGNIYVGSADKYMYAFTKSFKLKWKYKLFDKADSLIDSAAVVTSKGLLVIPGGDGYLHAVDKETGERKWIFKASGASDEDHSSGVIVNSFEGNVTEGPNGYLYAGNDNGYFYCLDQAGKLIWSIKTDMMIWSMAAFSANNDWMVFGSLDKHIYLVNPSNGKIFHKKKIGAEIKASPSIDEDKIFFGDSQGRYHGFEVVPKRKGHFRLKRIFKTKVGGEIYSSTANKDGKLVVGSLDGKMYSFDQKGKLRWSFNAYAPISSSPIIDKNNNVYFGTRAGKMYAVNLDSGHRVWSYKTSASNSKVNLDASPLLTQSGYLINGSYSGYIYRVPAVFCLDPVNRDLCEYGQNQDLPEFARGLVDGTHYIAKDRNGDYYKLEDYKYQYPQVLKLKLVHIHNGKFINKMAVNPIGLKSNLEGFETVISSDGETINFVPTKKPMNEIKFSLRGTLYKKTHWLWDRFKYVGLKKFENTFALKVKENNSSSVVEELLTNKKALYVNSLYVSQPKSLDTYIPAALDGQAFKLELFDYNSINQTLKAKVTPATMTTNGFEVMDEPSKIFYIDGKIEGADLIFTGSFKIAAMGGTIPFDSARFTVNLLKVNNELKGAAGEFFMMAKCLKLKGNGSNYTFSPALITETCDHKLRIISTGKFKTTIQ